MPSGPDGVTVTEYAALHAMPDDAAALFGGDFFSTRDWYDTVLEAGLPPDASACFVVISLRGRAAACFPMLRAGRTVAALTTPYTCLWRPLWREDLTRAERNSVRDAFGRWARPYGTIRLDCMAQEEARGLSCGLIRLPFDHFGAWSDDANEGWHAYWRNRPGHLREAARRRGARLARDGASFEILAPADIEHGIAAYEALYARSWKEPEPYPDFNAALMRRCAANGSLRLGLLRRQDAILAAQIWVVRENWAAVLKLAHDESARAVSPGTVLMAWMIERLMTQDGVTILDFGRGDDAYKQSWAKQRTQRAGLLLVSPWHVSAWPVLLRHGAGMVRRGLGARA